MQKKTSLAGEAKSHWNCIVADNLKFGDKEKKIAALKQVTIKEVRKMFKTLLFKQASRINF